MQLPSNLTLECTRFQQVIDARSNLNGKLELFAKLPQSDKFSTDAKPYCFAMLVDHVATLIAPKDLHKLYDAMEFSGAADSIRSLLTQDEYELVFGKVVRKALEHAPITPALGQVFDEIERSGISCADVQTVSIAVFAGVETRRLDDICDMLFEHCPDRRGRSPRNSVPVAKAA